MIKKFNFNNIFKKLSPKGKFLLFNVFFYLFNSYAPVIYADLCVRISVCVCVVECVFVFCGKCKWKMLPNYSITHSFAISTVYNVVCVCQRSQKFCICHAFAPTRLYTSRLQNMSGVSNFSL